MAIDKEKLEKVSPKLEQQKNIWMATVRPDGRPHLVPIWFVWADKKVWVSTGSDTVKVENLLQNDRISVALENGRTPTILEGKALLHTELERVPQNVLDAFQEKYGWDILTDTDEDWLMIEIVPGKLLAW